MGCLFSFFLSAHWHDKGADWRGLAHTPAHHEKKIRRVGFTLVSTQPERVDLSNDMTGRDMLAVGVRNVVLARGMLDKLEGPKYAERR